MNNFNFKKIVPHLVAVVVFLAVTFAYLNPLLKGKTIKMSDISNFLGMSKELVDYREANGSEALWTNTMFSGMPAYQISTAYPSNLLKHVDNLLMLYLPRPADYLFLCMIGFYFLMAVLRVDRWLAVVGAIAYAFCSYYVISLEVGHTSKAHAIAYMAPILASFILTYRGKFVLGGALTALFLALQLYCNHLQITYYTILLIGVYVLFEAVGAVKEKQYANFIKASVVVVVAGLLALLPNAGNIWFTYEYGKYTTRGKSELTIPSPADVQDKEAAARNNETGGLPRDYITGWSYGVGETFTLLIPNFKGGETEAIGNNKNALKKVDGPFKKQIAQSNAYYGDQPFTAGPTYAGAIIIFLFVLGIFFAKGRLKWALLIASILSAMFSWGSNFPELSDFLIDYLPGYNKFRSVSMTLTIANFCIPALGLLGLYAIITEEDFWNNPFTAFGKQIGKNWQAFVLAFALTGGLSLFMYLSPTTFNSFYSNSELIQIEQEKNDNIEQINYKVNSDPSIPKANKQEVIDQNVQKLEEYFDGLTTNLGRARIAIFQADALRSGLLILAAAIAIFLFLRFKFDRRILISVLGVLVLIDLIGVDLRFLNKDSFTTKKEAKVPFPANTAINSILEKKDLDSRTLNLSVSTFNDASTSYYVKSIGGYHGAKLKRYQQLIEFRINTEIGSIQNGFKQLGAALKTAKSNAEADSIYRANLNRMLSNLPTLNMLNTKYIIVDPSQPALYNPFALGNAWFVKDYQLVANPDSEIVALDKINPANTAVVDKRFEQELGGFKPAYDNAGTIKLTDYKANALVYESNAKTEQLAVFSEIYYQDGWQAYVDGQPVPHLRADFVLRAMKVPAGKHKIEFKFEPKAYANTEHVALAGSILLLLLVAGAAFAELRNKNTPKAA